MVTQSYQPDWWRSKAMLANAGDKSFWWWNNVRKHKNIFKFSIITRHKMAQVGRSLTHGRQRFIFLHNQCHGCWWPGDIRRHTGHQQPWYWPRIIPISVIKRLTPVGLFATMCLRESSIHLMTLWGLKKLDNVLQHFGKRKGYIFF